ncbi:MAG: PQQ-binding-like beta-propeller repeat protein [Rhodopirellula sp.]|nr:PQQ-binding-like beta-propeller repeat protein [Rhodopirellula sp.]
MCDSRPPRPPIDNTSHQPGANEIGSNYVSLPDSVYVTRGGTILRLDAATGRILREFPVQTNADNPDPRWGYLAVEEEVLVATSTPMIVRADAPAATTDDPAAEPSDNAAGDDDAKPGIDDPLAPAKYASTSRRLTATDRYAGRSLWQRAATYGFRHNNIAIGSGKLFVVDGLSAAQESQLARRGVDLDAYPSRLLAIDLRTREERWSTSEDVFGTFLSYSAQHDVLLQAGSASRDRAADETGAGMIAYRGSDGTLLWQALDRRHVGPCLLHDDTVITQGEAYSLMAGEPKLRRHPLTGEPLPWAFKRNYGCNTAIASRHLLTFRSAVAGFFDLARDGGTGNLGGFKSGCTSNLIAAGGLLNAPEYTRTCGCNYQNQTSLAMIHDPSAEMWTFNDLPWDGKPVRRVGINFGAPGDRRADNGTLWLEWPSVGGPSPDLPLTTEPEQVDTFRRHSSLITVPPEGDGLAWTAASGLRGVRRIELTLAKQPAWAKNYTVRLHFVEPDRIEAGQRRINVRLQGKKVLAGLDIAKEAGTMTALVKEFRGVAVTDELLIELAPADGAVVAEPVLAGVEAVAE